MNSLNKDNHQIHPVLFVFTNLTVLTKKNSISWDLFCKLIVLFHLVLVVFIFVTHSFSFMFTYGKLKHISLL